jgi:hypothetical protein
MWASRIEQILTVTGTAPPPQDPNDDDDDEVEDEEEEDQPDEPAVVREPDEDVRRFRAVRRQQPAAACA